jgi:hypothetical protein
LMRNAKGPIDRRSTSHGSNGEASFVFEPEESAVLELGPILALGTPDLVDGIVDELDGMSVFAFR